MGVREFFQWNKRLADRFWEKHGYSDRRLFAYYTSAVGKCLSPGMLVYDVGGGDTCCYAHRRKDVGNFRVIGLDITDKRLKTNPDVDGYLVSDITKEVPIPYGRIDMLTSSSVLEHLVRQQDFIDEAKKALKPGAYFIHVFPSKFALFAIANQLLSNRLAKKLLYALYPHLRESNGFRAYYNKTYYSAFTKLLKENGFEIVDVKCNYYQSDYFGFFLPLYALSLFWDTLMHLLHLKNMASQICVTARYLGEETAKA